MQGGVRHGPHVDEESKLAACEIFGQIHVGPAALGRESRMPSRDPCARVRVEVTG